MPPRDSEAWKTPLFEQYWTAKDGVPGALLFFRLGDFYELFGEDAVQAAPIMEVQLTSRSKGSKDSIPMCGVPAHAVDAYTEKLLARGLKIALCEQVSEPGKTKLVDRKVIRVLTPGLPTDFQRLDAKEPHWFYSIGFHDQKLQISLFDFLAAKLFEGEVSTDEELLDLFSRAKPQEILLSETVSTQRSFEKIWPSLNEGSRFRTIITPWIGATSRGNLEDYLKYTQKFSDQDLSQFIPEARGLHEVISSGGAHYARLPTSVLEQWNVFPELFELLDGCGSAVGSRRLRELLARPLLSVQRIQIRQEILKNFSEFESFLAESKSVYDFERILGRFRIGVAQPLELFRFLAALQHSINGLGLIEGQERWQNFFRSEVLIELKPVLNSLGKLAQELSRALDTSVEVVKTTDLNLLVRRGFNSELDHLKDTHENAGQWLVDFENKLKSETAISTLKVRFNKIFGYYIEVSNSHLNKVPSTFQRKQTTVNGERFTCQELTQKEKEILTAESQVEAKAREILENLQAQVLAATKELQVLIDHFAWADAWAGLRKNLRKLSVLVPWNYPLIEEGSRFQFSAEDLRHPILAARDREFVANSIAISSHEKPVMVLTGPNMAGKSTFMRQCGLAVLMAQCGLPVPATSMKLVPSSGFYSRMGASDRILSGESTFMVEMKECSQILRDADQNSFLLLDEIGRGTSTQDGLAIARAILKYIHDELGAPTIFATHYHELSRDADALSLARNASLGIREYRGRLLFLRKLEFQAAESSYGIYVAKLAGLPLAILKSAEKFFRQNLELENSNSIPQLNLFQTSATQTQLLEVEEPKLDPKVESILSELESTDVLELSPKEAWLRLESLVTRALDMEARLSQKTKKSGHFGSQGGHQSGGTSPESPDFLES